MTLEVFYKAAVIKAELHPMRREWDYFFYCMDRIYAWEDWMNRRS